VINFLKFIVVLFTAFLFVNGCTKQVEERLPSRQFGDIIYIYDHQSTGTNYISDTSLRDFRGDDFIGYGKLHNENPILITGGKSLIVSHDLSTSIVDRQEELASGTIKYFQPEKKFKLPSTGLFEFIRNIKSHGKRNYQLIALSASASFTSITISYPTIGRLERPSRMDYASDQPQKVFENIEGIIIGFVFPDKYNLLNGGKNKLFFISDDYKIAGKAENFKAKSMNVELDFASSINIEL